MKTLPVFCFLFFTSLFTYGQDTIHIKEGDIVEIMAEFPGGDKAWADFLMKNLNINLPQDNGAPGGTYKVEIGFRINTEGYLDSIIVMKDPGYGTVQEVIRVIKKSPRWNPGMRNNQKIESWRMQPITFSVAEEKKKKKKK